MNLMKTQKVIINGKFINTSLYIIIMSLLICHYILYPILSYAVTPLDQPNISDSLLSHVSISDDHNPLAMLLL